MANSIKQMLQDVNAGKYPKPKAVREPFTSGESIWPAHKPSDLEVDYWTDKVMEIN